MVEAKKIWKGTWSLLPAAIKLWPRLCFYSCLWFCPQGGVCLSACWDTTSPSPEQNPLGADSPCNRHPPTGSRHPSEQTPPEQTPPPPDKQTPAYGQWAAGTHPIGMHSCLLLFWRFFWIRLSGMVVFPLLSLTFVYWLVFLVRLLIGTDCAGTVGCRFIRYFRTVVSLMKRQTDDTINLSSAGIADGTDELRNKVASVWGNSSESYGRFVPGRLSDSTTFDGWRKNVTSPETIQFI